MDKSDIANRMKTYYEQIPKTRLMRRTPVIIRIDGKAFHTFTKHFERPFDEVLIQAMQETMKYLCENIQGCVLGYAQSDEISLLLVDYQALDTQAWFDNEVQKMCSVAASMATMAFNHIFIRIIYERQAKAWKSGKLDICSQYVDKAGKAMFDARCFNIPKEEVVNYFYWRQLDAMRNSVQMTGQANFSHSELENKNCNMIQEILIAQKDIDWNSLPTYQKRGSCCVKNERDKKWVVDKDIPVFKGDGRVYIEGRL